MKFQKILITGGSQGIGKSIVDLLVQEEAEIHVISRSFKNLDQYSEKLFFHPVDLSQCEKVQDFIVQFIERHGIPDLLINNAGCGAMYPWEEFPAEEIIAQINLMFLTPVILCREVVPLMVKKDNAVILNVSSLATIFPLPYMPLYNASKTALSSYTRSMMLEFKNNPVFIDLILGDVRTKFNDNLSMQKETSMSKKMFSAWLQIQKQLNDSPTPDTIAARIVKLVKKRKAGVFYEGGIFHKNIFPLLSKFISFHLTIKLLHFRYFKQK